MVKKKKTTEVNSGKKIHNKSPKWYASSCFVAACVSKVILMKLASKMYLEAPDKLQRIADNALN